MLSNLFNYDGSLMRFLSKVADIAIVNVLWLICSVPIITVGPATVALYYVLMKMAKNEEGNIVKMFFGEFKSHFLKKLSAGLILIVAGVLLCVDFYIVNHYSEVLGIGGFAQSLLFLVSSVLAVLYIMAAVLVFPLMAQFENSLKQTFVNSILIGMRFIYLVIPAGVISMIPVILFLWRTDLFIKSFVLWLILGVAGLAYLNTFIFRICFKPYMPEQLESETERESDMI